MNWKRTLALVPHYAASLLLILLVVGGIRTFLGNFGVVVELPIVVALILGYPTLVRWLGVAPAAWEE
jgi:hypothetical protein